MKIDFHQEKVKYEAKTLSKTLSGRPLSRTLSSRSGNSLGNRDGTDFSYDIPDEIIEENEDDLDSDFDSASDYQGRWTVKLHIDTGQTYFTDTIENISTWDNPFEGSEWAKVTEQINNIDAQNMKLTSEEAEKLAGFDLVPNRSVFKTAYVETSMKRLTSWLVRNELPIPDDYSPMLNCPEYLNVDRSLVDFAMPLRFHITLHCDVGEEDDETMSTIKTSEKLQSTVGDLLNAVFKRYRVQCGKSLDDNGIDGYVFKLVGYHEYFLHPDFKLGYYDAAVNALRVNVSSADILWTI